MTLAEARRAYAEEVRTASNIQTEALIEAFAKVPREHFLGPGPWLIANEDAWQTPAGFGSAGTYQTTSDADPVQLYHNVAVAIDSARILNNGHPSSVAALLDALELREGDRVAHIGCGVGYYTAIIAEVVGPGGHVIGVEIDPHLASRARENLRYLQQVDIISADGAEFDPGPADAIFVNAGATHSQSIWLDNLTPAGRLILPLTVSSNQTSNSMGFVFKVKRQRDSFAARFIKTVIIFPCIGARDTRANQTLLEAMKRGGWHGVRTLRRDSHVLDSSCWLHNESSCLSSHEVPLHS